MRYKQFSSAVAFFLCVICGVAQQSEADQVTIARNATFNAMVIASDLISATPNLECSGAEGVCEYHVIGTPKSWAGRPRDAIGGNLKNGQAVVAVTLQSAGNGRGHVFLALLWTKVAGRYRFVGYIPSNGSDINVALGGGDLVVWSGVYGPNDPDCCPKQTRIELDTLDGIKLRKISEATVPVTTFPGTQFRVPEKL